MKLTLKEEPNLNMIKCHFILTGQNNSISNKLMLDLVLLPDIQLKGNNIPFKQFNFEGNYNNFNYYHSY